MALRVLILTTALGSVLLAGCQDRWRPPPRPCPPSATAIPPAGIPDGPPPIGPPPGGVNPAGGNEMLLPQDPPYQLGLPHLLEVSGLARFQWPIHCGVGENVLSAGSTSIDSGWR